MIGAQLRTTKESTKVDPSPLRLLWEGILAAVLVVMLSSQLRRTT